MSTVMSVRVSADLMFEIVCTFRSDFSGRAILEAFFTDPEGARVDDVLPFELRTTYKVTVQSKDENISSDLDRLITDTAEWLWAVPASSAIESYATRIFRETDHILHIHEFGNVL